MARHRSPGTRHAPSPRRPHEQRTEQGDGARTGSRTPAHHSATILAVVAVAAVIAVIGSMLSFAGAIGGPPEETTVDLAADDLAILPTPRLPTTTEPADEEDSQESAEATTEAAETTDDEAGDDASAANGDEAGDEASEDAAPRIAARAARFPAEIIDADKWYLTLPTGAEGDPDTVETEDLKTYDSEYFQLTDEKDGVVFTANAGGATTENSKYPRSELREMADGEHASWDGRSGTHVMELDQAITKVPSTKPDVIAGQIHGGDDDVMQIHLSGSELTVKYDDGKKDVVLDEDYRLGDRFHVRIESSDGNVKVWHDGELKCELPIYGAESYFKAGAYVNSNSDKGASDADEGQVVVYGVKIEHSN